MSTPLNKEQSLKATTWLKDNFGKKMLRAVKDTPFNVNLLCAITCQETASMWLMWIDHYDVDTILQRCVFDPSGDFPDTHRGAFPRNHKEMRESYGDVLTDMLIAEGNLMRAMPQHSNPKGFKPAAYLYKGYGLFQYDLQNIKTDQAFFEHKLWYQFDNCLSRLIILLRNKYLVTQDLWGAVKAYNGAGPRADQYRENVRQMYKWTSDV